MTENDTATTSHSATLVRESAVAPRADLVGDLRCSANGSPEAFARIYDATVAPAYRLACCVVRDPSVAERVLVEAFREAWHDSGQYCQTMSVPAWVLSIVHRRAKVEALSR